MYLSRLRLDPLRRCTRELRLNPYLLHQAVFRAFPDAVEGGAGRVLYRLEVNRQGGTSLLVRSEKDPKWHKANMLEDCLLEPVQFQPFSPRFQAGQNLHFRLRANPTVKKSVEGRKNGYRLGLLREQEQIAWLQEKAKKGGFALLSCQAIPEGIVHDEGGRQDGKLSHYAVRFEGVLRIAEPTLFLETLWRGIGSAKGFGFGLLSIAPARS